MYQVPVKIEGIEKRKKAGRSMHLLAGLFLFINASFYVQRSDDANWFITILFFAIALTSLAYGLFLKRVDPMARYNSLLRLTQVISFIIIALLLRNTTKSDNSLSLYLWAGILAFTFFAERKVYHDTSLQIGEEGIFVPGYFSQHQIPWNIVSDFILRPDFVTISRTNQKYVQLELLADIPVAEIQQINTFSKEQIIKAEKE